MHTIKEQREAIKKRLCEWGAAVPNCDRRWAEIKDLQRQIAEMDDVLRGQSFDSMPKGSGVGNPTARALEAKEHTACRIAQLMEEIAQIMERKERMDAQLDVLPVHLRSLVDMHYRQGLNMHREIPHRLNIGKSTAYDWMEEVLEKIANMQSPETSGKNL